MIFSYGGAENTSTNDHDHDYDHDHDHDHGVDDNPFSDYKIGLGKWGPSGALGTAGGTVTWSLPSAGLTNQTGYSFFTGSTVSFSSIVNFNYTSIITQVFDAWSAVANIDFQQVTDGGGNIGVGSTANIRIVAGYIDGAPSGGSVLARAYLPTSGGTSAQSATSGDVVMDSAETWDSNLFFLTMLHEVGHSLGLEHSDSTSAIMYPYINTSLTGLSADDIAGIRALYGNGGSTTDDYDDTTATTGAVAVGGSATGAIETAFDDDWFRINLTAGQSYEFNLAGVDGQMDTYLQLRNSSGTILASDDDSGVGLAAKIDFTATTTGVYYLAASAYSTVTGNYRLTADLATGNNDDVGSTAQTASTIGSNQSKTGEIESGNDQDWYALSVTSGLTYTMQLRGAASAMGTLSDTVLVVYSAAGTILDSNDDNPAGGLESYLEYTASFTGTVYVSAQSYSFGTGTYTLSVAGPPAGPTSGDDNLAGTSGDDVISLLDGDDIYYGYGGNDTIYGDDGDDQLHGGAGTDIINGNDGNDLISGGGGNDQLYGGAGADVILGNSGDDIFYGQSGRDTISGFAGRDTIFGGGHSDIINGNGGKDIIYGGGGNDDIQGGTGRDLIVGGVGDDTLAGGLDNDVVVGGEGGDMIFGGGGSDVLLGQDGHDVIYGAYGKDRIFGGSGDDWLSGGGNDGQQDIFWFEDSNGMDRVVDFEDGVDLIGFSSHSIITQFSDVFARVQSSGTGGQNTTITIDANNSITLVNYALSDFSADDFIF